MIFVLRDCLFRYTFYDLKLFSIKTHLIMFLDLPPLLRGYSVFSCYTSCKTYMVLKNQKSYLQDVLIFWACDE